MFILWGKKLVRKHLGYAADFCPICRSVQAFGVERIRRVRHLYYLPLGRGVFLGHVRTCQQCGTEMQADPGHYRALVPRIQPLPALILATQPDWQQQHAARWALEQRVQHQAAFLSADERRALVAEPFFVLDPWVQAQLAPPFQMDREAWRVLGAWLLVWLFGVPMLSAVWPELQGEIMLTAVGGGVLAWLVTVLTRRRRHVHRRVLPLLVRALKPLRPQAAELDVPLGHLRQQQSWLGTLLDATRLHAALQDPLPDAGAVRSRFF